MRKSDKRTLPKLGVIIAEETQTNQRRVACIKKLLEDNFDIFELQLCQIDHDFSSMAHIFIVPTSLESASTIQLDYLRIAVCEKGSTIIMLHDSALYPQYESFFSCVGVHYRKHFSASIFKVRVFPHFLTRGLNEIELVEDKTYDFDSDNNITPFDNVFLRMEDGYPLGYERLYGKKGRIFYLALGYSLGMRESPVIEKILKNLYLLSFPFGDSIDAHFHQEKTLLYSFQADHVTEPISEVARWNTLYDKKNNESVYSHSALSLPLTPEFYQKKVEIWRNASDKHDEIKNLLSKSLTSVEIRNTDFCNQDCYYCYNRKSLEIGYEKTLISPEIHLKLENDLLKHRQNGHLFAVRYTGAGDPLCYNRTIESIVRFEKEGIPTCLITNGMGMRIDEAFSLGENSTMIRFSLDAASAEVYAQIRRLPESSYYKVLDNLRAIIKSRDCANRKGYMLVGVTFLVCQENYKQIFEFCQLMAEIGVDVVWIRSVNDMPLFSEKEIELINTEIEKAKRLNNNEFFVFSIQFHIFRRFLALHYRYGSEKCWSSFTKAFVLPNGNVTICLSHKELSLGNIYSNSFFDIWGGERHINFIMSQEWTHCSQCIESRFNVQLQFLSNHKGNSLFKSNVPIF